jgi:hypothetical protein
VCWFLYIYVYTVCFNNLKTLHFAHKVVYVKPFKSHISVMVRKLFNLHATLGQCYTVHPSKVKYHIITMWGSIKSPYILNCGTVEVKSQLMFSLFISGCFIKCLWSVPHSHMSMLHNDWKCEFKSCVTHGKQDTSLSVWWFDQSYTFLNRDYTKLSILWWYNFVTSENL